MHAKINVAVKMLLNWSTGIHTLSRCLIRVLLSYFDSIDEAMKAVLKAATLTKGAGGPSQLDYEQYQHILSSHKFKKENKKQIARSARLLASEIVDTHSVDSLVKCRLITLNKNPGIQPIGVGEVIRRIIGKCIEWVMKKDIQEAAGPLQMATGLQSGAEAVIHSIKEIFDDEQTDAVVLVDAINAFNSLNRNAALHNMQILYSQFSAILINMYRLPVRMTVFGSKDVVSNEEATPGNNLAMSFYALGTATLLNYLLITSPNVKKMFV